MSLYERFCQLDRNAKGFISAEEFLSVPEFAMNPLSQVESYDIYLMKIVSCDPYPSICCAKMMNDRTSGI